VIPTACAAGNYAIAYACEALTAGKADYMLAGGVDPWSRIAYYGFNAMMAITPDVCRPFDRHRKGILISEGAGIVVLRAEARRAGGRAHLAELAGCGIAADGYHMTGPHPEGRASGQRGCSAPAQPRRHGCALLTEPNTCQRPHDAHHDAAARRYRFPWLDRRCWVTRWARRARLRPSSARAIETAIPPTINYETPDPDCALDVAQSGARSARTWR
jgi:3-oxoacyl-[acyl-carrier-protein] synthase II